MIKQNQYELVLATDLDGTFLEGDHQVKENFYYKLSRLRTAFLQKKRFTLTSNAYHAYLVL